MRAVPVTIAVLVLAVSSAAWGRGRPHLCACGRVETRAPNTGSVKIFSVSQVSALRLSCKRALAFVRTWHALSDKGKLPNRADVKVTPGMLRTPFLSSTLEYKCHYHCSSTLLDSRNRSCKGLQNSLERCTPPPTAPPRREALSHKTANRRDSQRQ